MTERPDTRLSSVICALGAAAAVAIGVWLWNRILQTPDQKHPWEFIGLALLFGLTLYLCWVLAALASVRYTLAEGYLILRQWPSRVEIPVTEALRVVRWRSRWLWSGKAEQELGISTLAFIPLVWFGRSTDTWVLLYQTKKGDQAGVVLRCSHRLLNGLKTSIPPQESAGD